MDSPSNQTDSSLPTKQTQTNPNTDDEFLQKYEPSDFRIASEFLATWLPFLSRDLCPSCSLSLSHRIQSLHPSDADLTTPEKLNGDCEEESTEGDETNSLGSWKDTEEPSTSGGPRQRMSWADMAEDELLAADEEDEEVSVEDTEPKRVVELSYGHVKVSVLGSVGPEKPKLSREQRERIRFMNVKRKKDFICLERVKGKIVNVLDGLELHKGVFSAAEQKRIVECVYDLQEKGMKGELKERTYSAPQKWMKGKGTVTIQFGCCYNYANDEYGNPPGILQHETVDPIPPLFRVIIRRLVQWHVLPPSCVPDSCIVNIYDEGDCLPPHIDNHDFVRPFCTVSFLSECNIVFGTNLKAVGPGEFEGAFAIALPVGSVLVLNGNSADVAKHCVPSVSTKRISITFRKMDETKHPISFVPEPDLQGILPLPYEMEQSKRMSSPKFANIREKPNTREEKFEARRYQSEPRRGRRGSANKQRVWVNVQR